MLIKEKKPFNTSTKLIPLSDSAIKLYDSMMKSRASKILTSEELEKKFTELYLENEKLKAKKDKLLKEKKDLEDEKYIKDCTFHPKINPEIEAFMTSGTGSFLKRENDWVSKKEKRIKELETESEKKQTKECSFHPKISKKSYSLLFKNKSDKKPQNLESETERPSTTSRSMVGSYRLIHEKKDSYRELAKTSSFNTFNLMTERRYLERLEQQQLQKVQDGPESHSMQDSIQEQFSFSSITLPFNVQHTVCQPVYDDYIENIVIKTEEQDTFNSLSSLEMRSERKVENEEIKNQIFEEEVEEESLDQVEPQEDGSIEKQESESNDGSYDAENIDNLSENEEDSKITEEEEQIETDEKEENNEEEEPNEEFAKDVE